MSNPRIIAGKARGMRLQDVPGNITRPITDRVKEALFNILAGDIPDCTFLDCFGGTGSVGIEALSRGANFVRLIDLNRAAVRVIQANLDHTRLGANAQVVQADTLHFLKQKPDREFDFIYVAPPQYKDLWLKTLQLLDGQTGWLAQQGWIIVQIDPVEYREIQLQNLREFDQRRYGSTLLVFYDRQVLTEMDA